jgi:hypothetical protein
MALGSVSCHSKDSLCDSNYCEEQGEFGIPYICKPPTGFKQVKCFVDQAEAMSWCQGKGGEARLPPCANYLDGGETGGTDTGGPSPDWNPGLHVTYDGRGVYHVDREFVAAIKADVSLLENEFGYLTPTRSGYYTLERVALGDLADVMGLRSGDLLINVNGHDLGTLDKAMTAYAELQDEVEYVLTVNRNGALIRNVYVVGE